MVKMVLMLMIEAMTVMLIVMMMITMWMMATKVMLAFPCYL